MFKQKLLLIFLLLLTPTPNLPLLEAHDKAEEKPYVNPLIVRMPRMGGTAPFVLQAHIFSRDPVAEEIRTTVESPRFYKRSKFGQQTLTDFRLPNLPAGKYSFLVEIFGGKENKVLHSVRINFTVIGPGMDPEEE